MGNLRGWPATDLHDLGKRGGISDEIAHYIGLLIITHRLKVCDECIDYVLVFLEITDISVLTGGNHRLFSRASPTRCPKARSGCSGFSELLNHTGKSQADPGMKASCQANGL